jgi:4-hydroxy-4-methyl-2-oxoglutarate aldolase
MPGAEPCERVEEVACVGMTGVALLTGRVPVGDREAHVGRVDAFVELAEVRRAERIPDRVAASATGGTVRHVGQDRRVLLPDWMCSTLASDGAGGQGALPYWIRALSPKVTVAGPALVVTVTRDDNSPMREVPGRVERPGTVLVVAGAADSRTAVLGDLVAHELLRAGVGAVVTDGLIRDSRSVTALGLPVWARGTTPVASRKDGTGSVGGSVELGGVTIADGDLVIADADGVVVWPVASAATYLERADEKRIADEQRAAAGN